MTTILSAKITFWVNRFISLILLVLTFTFPALMRWYQGIRPLGPYAGTAVCLGFYLCVPMVGYALWCIDRLMKNILADAVFVSSNVRYVRRIRWCCAGVSGVCAPAAFYYPPLIFMTVIMAFLALVISVVKSVLAAAVELREENDLTV